jgi:hypothetical protein
VGAVSIFVGDGPVMPVGASALGKNPPLKVGMVPIYTGINYSYSDAPAVDR